MCDLRTRIKQELENLMNHTQFRAYLNDYNRGDMVQILAHYTDDLAFQSFGRPPTFGGDSFNFLKEIKSLFDDSIHADTIVIEGAHAAIDAVLDQTAKMDLPDFFAGPKRKGDVSRMRILALYQFRGDKICSIKLCGWPEN
jgi:ketosteroid isomerase-like protein